MTEPKPLTPEAVLLQGLRDVADRWPGEVALFANGVLSRWSAARAAVPDAGLDPSRERRTPMGEPSFMRSIAPREISGTDAIALLAICGQGGNYGRLGEPLVCGHPAGHTGDHAWVSLPTFVDGEASVRDEYRALLLDFVAWQLESGDPDGDPDLAVDEYLDEYAERQRREAGA